MKPNLKKEHSSFLENAVWNLRYVSALLVLMTIAVLVSCSSDDESPALPTITSFTPTEALPGTEITINGENLGTATSVQFNGTDAVIVSKTARIIKTTVPTNATSGKIKVTTPAGSATSADDFTVKCSGFLEASPMDGAFKIVTTFQSIDNAITKEVYTTNTEVDEITFGVTNPDEEECSSVAKFEKTPNTWDGWNGVGVILDANLSESDFNQFASLTATEEAPPAKKIKLDVYYDAASVPEGGIDFFINSGKHSIYAYPYGRSQFFAGKITKAKEWETITFEIKWNGDGEVDLPNIDVDDKFNETTETDFFEFLPDGGNTRGGVFYFDNFRIE
jgi:hypothetical protein